jgi:large subunit ribosomal protein L24
MHVKKDDIVVVISGTDKGKKGKVLQSIPKKNRVIVEGVKMVTKHVKPSRQMQQGGRIHQEASIHISNVMLYDPKEKSGTRVKHERLEDGTKVRVSVKSGEVLD